MSIVVEDGTGKSDAVSYASYAELQAYAGARAVDISGGNQAAWEAALVKATDYVDTHRFRGQRSSSTQALQFPRTGLYDDLGEEITGLPVKLVQATIEYAFRARTGELFLEPTVDATGQQIASVRKVVGPITKEVSYSTAVANTRKAIPSADSKLSEFVISGGEAVRN